MNTYTDPTLLDVAGAMEMLPVLSSTSGGRLVQREPPGSEERDDAESVGAQPWL